MLLPPYSYQNDSLGECLLDLSVRFVINCPHEDLSTAERLFFQIEEAHWFYEDFVRVDNPSLPSMKLRTFVDRLFKACPFLHDFQADPLEALTSFQSYKSLIPVRGGIILNKEMNKVLMVKGWRSNSTWGFPKGKINKDEPDSQCAIREVYEECGFDMTPYLVEDDYLEVTRQGKNIRLYVIRGVPEDTVFETQTRKEISKISWHNLNKMPLFSRRTNNNHNANYYLAAPFMPGLKKYINKCKGLATSLSSTETKALENVLGGSSSFENDEQAAKNLLSLLKGTGSDTTSTAQSDTAILLNLIKGDHKTTDLESAQQVLGLYAQQSDVPTVEPTKIVLPEQYATIESPAIPTPPLPPNSMLQNLVSSRQNKHKGAGLLSILSQKPAQHQQQLPKPTTYQSNDLLSLLQPATSVSSGPSLSSVPECTPESAARRTQTDDLMSLLTKSGSVPAHTPPEANEAPKNVPLAAAPTPVNDLMDLLKPKPTIEATEETDEPTKEVIELKSTGQPANGIDLMSLLNKPIEQTGETVPAEALKSSPQSTPDIRSVPELPQQDDAGIGLLNLLKKAPSTDPYPTHDSLLEYLARATS